MPRLINTHDQLRAAVASGLLDQQHALAIAPSYSAGAGNDGPQNGWLLFSPYFDTDPTASWYHHGQLWFGYPETGPALLAAVPVAKVRKAQKELSLQAAVAHARQVYSLPEWSRNRLGDYVPAQVESTFPIPAYKTVPISSAPSEPSI